jgi:hypothetical protein
LSIGIHQNGIIPVSLKLISGLADIMDGPGAISFLLQNIRDQESGHFITIHYQNMSLIPIHNDLVLFIQEAKGFHSSIQW